jgi:hypothetical protein
MKKRTDKQKKEKKQKSQKQPKEKKSRLERKWIIVIISVSILAALAVSISVPLVWYRNRKSEQVEYAISESLREYELGYVEKAKRTLDKNLSSFKGSDFFWMHILKHVYKLTHDAENTDYIYYQKWAERAFKDTKGKEIGIVFADSLSKNGYFKEAFKILKDNNLKKAEALKAYCLKMSGNITRENLKKIIPDYQILIQISEIEKADEMKNLAQRYKLPELYQNVAVLLMKEASLTEGYKVSSEFLQSSRPLLHSFIAYDNGRFKEAFDSFQFYKSYTDDIEKDEILYHCDLLNRIEENEQALTMLYDFIKRWPEYSPVPYNNIAYLEKGRRSDDDRLQLLQDGLRLFSGNIELVLSVADLLIEKGEIDRAKAVIEDFLRINPENVEARLKYNFLADDIPIEKFIGVLWQMHYENPDNERILQMAAWYLTGIYDYRELKLVLERSEQVLGQRPWIELYYGILYANAGNTSRAHASFLQSADKFKLSWQNFYNAALISYVEADYRTCLEELDNAQELYSGDEDQTFTSNFFWLRGEVANTRKDYLLAKDYLIKANSINPGNLKAQLRLKTVNNILEEQNND